jgi:ADP-heptose:LPS heptosyltransferase
LETYQARKRTPGRKGFLMQLITLRDPISITLQRSTGVFTVTYQANSPYVISNSHYRSLIETAEFKKSLFKASTYDYRIPNFNVLAAKKHDPVLFYNGSGGFGDQIISWPVAKILSQMGFEVHVLTEPGLDICWWHFPWVKSIITMPIAQPHLEMWKHMAFMEAVVNFDEHSDQLHPLDAQLKRYGIDPRTIDPAAKVIPPVFSPNEKERASTLIGAANKIGVYQLSSTSITRSLATDQSITTLHRLATRWPRVGWIAIYDAFTDQDLVNQAKAIDLPNVKVLTFDNLRVLWAVVAMADVCVGPDSMLIHIAGSMGTPAVGLWGPMTPDSRARYYSNHTAIWHKNACQFSPCFISSITFPDYCPPLPEPRKRCAVLTKIDPEDVCSAVDKYIG